MTPTSDTDLLRTLLVEQIRGYAILLIDVEGQIVDWLADASQIFGYAREEAVGQQLGLLFTSEDRAMNLPAQELTLARVHGYAEDDRWHVRQDGVRIWVTGLLLALRADGEIRGFAKILRDRTDIKAQLEAAELHAAALSRNDRRKDLFLATLAHELRNPLAPLVNALQLIRMTGMSSSAEAAYPLGIIERQVALIRRLVDDLQDIARINAGKVQLDQAPLPLQQVLQQAFDACQPLARQRELDYRAVLVGATLTVCGDADRLEQVFVNLLTNAIKFTPPGGRILLIATVEGDEAVVHVQDTGIGISPEVLPRIFDLFTQEEASRARGPGGLGLGLALVRQLVGLHGGTVQVRSDGRGHGSTFTVRLPLERATTGGTEVSAPGA